MDEDFSSSWGCNCVSAILRLIKADDADAGASAAVTAGILAASLGFLYSGVWRGRGGGGVGVRGDGALPSYHPVNG